MTHFDRERTVKKWEEWFDEINEEVRSLFVCHKIDKRVFEIILANPSINKGNLLYDWMTVNYVHRVMASIRRILDDPDRKTDAISLAKLVRDIARFPCAIDRTKYVSRFKQQERESGFADRAYDNLVGKGNNYLASDVLIGKLEEVKHICNKAISIADKSIAHHDKKAPEEILWPELDEAIGSIGNLFSFVSRLITGTDNDYSEITDLSDWEWVFHESWITHQYTDTKVGDI